MRRVPGCVVYVYDNRSSDGTGDIARKAGAIVRREERPGKGGVCAACSPTSTPTST